MRKKKTAQEDLQLTSAEKGKTALLEIGVEDIPASYFPAPLEQLKQEYESALALNQLPYERVEVLATPRRLAIIVFGLATKASSIRKEIKGPPASVAYDAQGNPTQAAIGFAKAQGVEVNSLVKMSADKGEYVFARLSEKGKPAEEVLPRIWERLIRNVYFPKTMRWGTGTFRFVRPIQWLTAMIGSRVVAFTFEGVKAGNTTFGHRFISQGKVKITSAGKYLELLRQAGVIIDQVERRKLIQAAAEGLADAGGGLFIGPEELAEEVTFMCEHPTLFLGDFDPEFLSLPGPVLETIMRKHQRYFAVHSPNGLLLPHFIAVRDGDERNLEGIKKANERVLRARLKDGVFFFQQDMRRKLEERVPDLEKVVLQEGLGTMRDKAARLSFIVARMGEMTGLEEEAKAACGRAAWLCKADLVTQMVKELPELQGVVGGNYAGLQGEPAAVTTAITEHYLPQSADDPIPSTREGQVLALADKLDTLCSYLSIGLTFTGSEDPYGLRRMAQGAVRILFEGGLGLGLSLSAVVGVCCEALQESGIMLPEAVDLSSLARALLVERMRQWLLDRELPRDVVNATFGFEDDFPQEVKRRAFSMNDFLRKDERMSMLAVAATRVSNILNSKPALEEAARRKGGPDEAGFEDKAEGNLHQVFNDVERSVSGLQTPVEYGRLLNELTPLVEPINNFFDNVLVMTEDKRLRANRLALLRAVQGVLVKFGDLSQLEMDGGTGRWLGAKE
jgi:glycyl-tRNA synthetase beta chain